MNNGNKPEKINGWIETRNGLRIRQKRGCKYKECLFCGRCRDILLKSENQNIKGKLAFTFDGIACFRGSRC